MSNSRCFPIVQTDEIGVAVDVVRRLVAVGGTDPIGEGQRGAVVDVLAVFGSHTDSLRHFSATAARIPSARTAFVLRFPPDCDPHVSELVAPHTSEARVTEETDGIRVSIRRAGAMLIPTLARLPEVPVECWIEDIALGKFDWSSLDLLAGGRAHVCWRLQGWPRVADLGLAAEKKHAGVRLSVNSSGLFELLPGNGYTVHVETGPWQGSERRARWLAAWVGQSVLGVGEWS